VCDYDAGGVLITLGTWLIAEGHGYRD